MNKPTMSTYKIQIRGQVTEAEINRMSPIEMCITKSTHATTLFHLYTDQSGIIGLMRHLHNQGFLFTAVLIL